MTPSPSMTTVTAYPLATRPIGVTRANAYRAKSATPMTTTSAPILLSQLVPTMSSQPSEGGALTVAAAARSGRSDGLGGVGGVGETGDGVGETRDQRGLTDALATTGFVAASTGRTSGSGTVGVGWLSHTRVRASIALTRRRRSAIAPQTAIAKIARRRAASSAIYGSGRPD